MDFYPLLIFLHVLGGVGLFAAIGIEAVALRRLERAVSLDQVRVLMTLLRESVRVGGFTMGLLLVAGIWMMALRWGPAPWIVTALVGFVPMAVLALAVTPRGIRRLVATLGDDTDSVPADFRALAAGGSLMASHSLRASIVVGILGLMTIKPDVLGSAAIMAAAALTGAAMALRGWRKAASSADGPRVHGSGKTKVAVERQ